MNIPKYPVFNFAPLDKLASHLKVSGTETMQQLLRDLVGDESCCWGNPCYHKACLACFCRGNIKYLTAEQAKIQDGKIFPKAGVEFGDRIPSIREDDVLDHSEHLSDDGIWLK